MSKLFALESVEEETMASEMEVGVEEGEVADVQAETDTDSAEIDSQEDAVEEGMEAADQLEEIEEVVEASVEEGEGLDPIAAEAIRIAVEAVGARVGYNTKNIYSLYAKENFESASSRKANTRIALEGIGDFLKNLWEKIKAAVSSIWTKITDFWNKHISNLGRVLKALESMEKKVGETKGSPNQPEKELKASASLANIFAGKGTLDSGVIGTFITTHTAAKTEAAKFSGTALGAVDEANFDKIHNKVTKLTGSDAKVSLGSDKAPLAGGVTYTYTLDIESEENSVTVKLDFEEDSSSDKDSDRDLNVDGKDKLKANLKAMSAHIKTVIKSRDKVKDAEKSFNNAKKAIDAKIQSEIDDADNKKKAASALRAFSTIHSKVPAIETKLATKDVQLAKGVLSYTAVCLKNYKV